MFGIKKRYYEANNLDIGYDKNSGDVFLLLRSRGKKHDVECKIYMVEDEVHQVIYMLDDTLKQAKK